MPDPFLGPIFERIAREQRAGMRIGTLTAIDAGDGSVTVSLAGDLVPGVRWVGSYTPVVNDVVVVSRVEAMWVVLGKLSKQLGVPVVRYETVTVSPSEADFVWWAAAWGWSAYTYHDLRAGYQGLRFVGDTEQIYSIVYLFPALAPSIPSGATVTGARLSIRRIYGVGQELVQPVIYQHDKTVDSYLGGGAPPPTLGSVWRPGSLAADQLGTWNLPSAWLTAWLAGTTKGITLYSDSAVDLMYVGGANNAELTISYSIPV